jgi:peptidoglycan biosynthesis protein MviN/MurJ (putative lipid II flippase)
MIDILILVWLHFIADFILQSDKMAINKSSDNKWLALHVIIYTLPLFWFGFWFALINGTLHYVTDYFTSRWTSRLWAEEKRHWFFVVIGLDQALHLTALFVTYSLLIGF